ncbi:MAG TPA: 2,3-bisphosphoglycerate-independent phosphoglycerate mutase [Candidatus Eisenbacteria bacterium]|uniref:2,3-bisphosphoglycerate-independent phosphoglycerate mutase n=1 Tax=Eiseniibacteriota bacterium TaxID=2212470 RepID=A0A7V2AV41_UNCEI|nr:2,3-bisphosphoglycerate-independent phosphoglycerate mutase [Candidatus Eisenbacteria bacterium]
MLKALLRPNGGKIVLLVMDGLGGIRTGEFPQTALEKARTPNMDRLAAEGLCGRSTPISLGVTPGSGPAHLALFGYDPLAPENDLGRGATEVTGVGFALKEKDIAIRGNFATVDDGGVLTDRRAGRLPHEECVRICAKLQEGIREIDGVEIIVMPVREYRFGVVLRGEDLSPEVEETDPLLTGKKPLRPAPRTPKAGRTAAVIEEFVRRAGALLAEEPRANTVLMRGISRRPHLEPFNERYGLRGAAIASYPLYRGVAGLCGMDLIDTGFSVKEEFDTLESSFGGDHDFFFVHIKKTDSYGEDGNIEGKAAVIEEVDAEIPRLLALRPGVIVITGDHSTPCALKGHSWHPVPLLVSSALCGRDGATRFDEIECDRGGLGVFPATKIMELALANAGRLKKFGA